jgi:hypothetical protein
MIPVCAHRYLPAGRGSYAHPVLSIYETDIIIYGTDLAEYISHEFTDPGRPISPDWVPIFWSVGHAVHPGIPTRERLAIARGQ